MRWFLPFVFVFLNSCIIHRVEVTPVELRDQPEITVESPVKALYVVSPYGTTGTKF